VTLQRAVELQSQKEIIERWLDIPSIPTDAHQRLVEMLAEVNAEMKHSVLYGGPSMLSR
jgi:hypothetical protein